MRDLLKHKSFFLLIFLLIFLDRVLRYFIKVDKSGLKIPETKGLGIDIAIYLFEDLPGLLYEWLFDYRTFLIVVVLFLFKQLTSMWPSSDMRRIHRKERERFGLFSSLVSIHGKQVIWDAIAVGSIVLITGSWALISYLISRSFWKLHPSSFAVLLFAFMAFLIFPIAMGGFSFSSKLAVLSKGSFRDKLGLFFQLLINRRIFWPSWLFFLFRIVVEVIFVVVIPVAVILSMDNFLLRIIIAGLIATPLYSFLKMVTFKFFLQVYQPFPLVQEEYASYYVKSDK